MVNYFIELAIVHVALFFGYWLFLRKEQQFAKMRSYLIASTLLALTIPILKLPRLFSFDRDLLAMTPVDGLPKESTLTDSISLNPVPIASAESVSAYELIMWTYMIFSFLLLLKFLAGIVYLVLLKRRSHIETINGLTIRRVANIKGSFSFFNWIFLSDEIDPRQHDYDVILKHEQAHASLGHTYDLILLELFKACFWWLPTAWIVLKETKQIHEYQADAVVIETCDVDRYSSILISSALKTNGLNVTSSSHDGLILNRLEAMKQQTTQIRPWKLEALGVLCISLVIVLACSEENSLDKADDETFTAGEAYPEFEGGIAALNSHLLKEIRYPSQARQAGVEGRVDVQFVVDKDGSIAHVEAMKGIGAGCDEEAVRAVKTLPRFKPAAQNGRPARVRMVVPIVFQLKAGDTHSDNGPGGMVIIDEIQSSNYKLTVEASYENGEWTGTIYDQWWEELPGANIIVPGTTGETTSAEDGTFKLKAEEGNSIVVSFVGYGTVAIVTNLMGPSPKNWPDVEKVIEASRNDIPPYRDHQHWLPMSSAPNN